jgi:hypothetical protein
MATAASSRSAAQAARAGRSADRRSDRRGPEPELSENGIGDGGQVAAPAGRAVDLVRASQWIKRRNAPPYSADLSMPRLGDDPLARRRRGGRMIDSANRRPGGASGSVIARVGLLTELGVSARPSRTLAGGLGAIKVNAHQDIAHALKAKIFFATPYHAWERGLNENTNGLIRDFFPKGTDFSTISNAEVAKVERLLNARPRKSLGFRSPQEVFRSLAYS